MFNYFTALQLPIDAKKKPFREIFDLSLMEKVNEKAQNIWSECFRSTKSETLNDINRRKFFPMKIFCVKTHFKHWAMRFVNNFQQISAARFVSLSCSYIKSFNLWNEIKINEMWSTLINRLLIHSWQCLRKWAMLNRWWFMHDSKVFDRFTLLKFVFKRISIFANICLIGFST